MIDTSLVNEVIGLCTSVLGLLGEFPLNVIVIGSLASVAFRIIRQAKRVAR
jgi:hypothetical protein